MHFLFFWKKNKQKTVKKKKIDPTLATGEGSTEKEGSADSLDVLVHKTQVLLAKAIAPVVEAMKPFMQ